MKFKLKIQWVWKTIIIYSEVGRPCELYIYIYKPLWVYHKNNVHFQRQKNPFNKQWYIIVYYVTLFIIYFGNVESYYYYNSTLKYYNITNYYS